MGENDSAAVHTSLVVVDDDIVRRDLSGVLGVHGHRVRADIGHRSALRSLARTPADFVFIQWPGNGGWASAFCRQATASTVAHPCMVLAVVSPPDPAAAGAALDAGATDVVVWPVDQRLLSARIRVLEARLVELRHRLAAEEESTRIARRFNATAAGCADGLWDWDLTTGTVYYSARWKELLGAGDGAISGAPNEWFSRIHPDDVRDVRERLDDHLRGASTSFTAEHRVRHADGSYRWVVARGVAVARGKSKPDRIAGSLTDISERKAAEARLLHDVAHDALTGLPNRTRFFDRLQRLFERARRHGSPPFAVLFLDIDRFKLVNDGIGHLAGDRLLVGMARRLEQSIRPVDTVARLGGDEFAVIVDAAGDPREATVVAERIQKALRVPFDLGGQEVFATVSIGISQYGTTYHSADELLRDADIAMYRAKALGRDRFAVFDQGMHEKVVATLRLETDLRRALEAREFAVHYQPIVALDSGHIVGFEALVRWLHPRRGMVLPGEFIQAAEETGLIIGIDRWVAAEACRQLRTWQVQFRRTPALTMSVNVSGAQFMQPDLPMQVDRILRENGLWGSALKLEITESVIMEKARYTVPMLEHLRGLAIRLSIDDFGTGYSSLAYLRRFEIDTLKIDSSFVGRMTSDDEASEIVRTIVSLARNLRKDMIAEGVETASQLAKLRTMQCTFAQGYFFSRPVAADAATKLLVSNPKW